MDSSSALGIGPVAGLWADPYLWGGAAALFVGLAAGQVLRALRRSRRRADSDHRIRAARFSRAIALFSLGILALAALFVLADKAGLSGMMGAGSAPLFIAFCAAAFLAGAAAGGSPLFLGLPIAGLVAAFLCLVGLALEGWAPLRADSGPKVELARLLPYEVGPSSFRGQIELTERDSAPVAQDVGLPSASVGVRVECLELREPLRLAACLASPRARAASAAYAPTLRLYRLVGLALPDDSSPGAVFGAPAHASLLELALPLPPDGGFAPGSSPARVVAAFGLAVRVRLTSACAPLVALQSLSFDLALPAFAIELRPGR
jgi:hypothetical protein